MRRRFATLFSILVFINHPLPAQNLQPIGYWRDHLPYHQAISVEGYGELIWAATPFSLFSVNTGDNSIERWSKMNGLSEAGIKMIGVEKNEEKIVIAYNNGNIDILYNGNIFNVDAFKNATVTGDKTIYNIYSKNNRSYLSTGIGIVVIDLDKYEVQDTYIIGNNGNKIKVYGLSSDHSFFYAATDEGLKIAPVSGINLADYRNWQLVSGTNGLPTGVPVKVLTFDDRVIIEQNDSLFISSGNNWSFFYSDTWKVNGIDTSPTNILISETLNQSGRILQLTPSGSIDRVIQDTVFTRFPRQSFFFNNEYWIADSLNGLSKFSSNGFQSYTPVSPFSIAMGDMDWKKNVLWVTAGDVTANWQPTGNQNGFYKFSENTWINYNAENFHALDSLPDIITIAIDPLDETIWAGSYGGGLLNFKNDNELVIFKQNSPLQGAYFSPTSYRVSGLAFDRENNLWIANYGANQNLLVKKTDGTWDRFSVPFPVPEKAIAQIIIDDYNQKWMILPNGNGLACFNHGISTDNPADDQWKWYRSGQGQGNLPDDQVLCITKDLNGFIWIGSAKGIGIIQCPQEIFNAQGCEALLPVVQQDNFAGYLFRDEEVRAISVDGADRKWVGTKNGLWLISPDGDKTILRFTEENSPLLSNDIRRIAIDHQTGEVFFSTAKGICSYRSTATGGSESNDQVLIFPNPVPPGYTGTIAIRGLVNQAIVKITELNGRLVYETSALGGQANWNGKDYLGRQISTGIYLVLVSDETRQEKIVSKIVFISK